MSYVLTLRIEPGKLAKLDKRAAAVGQDRSSYVRHLIERDLISAEPRKHKFASADLLGAYRTGIKSGDNKTIREIVRSRATARK